MARQLPKKGFYVSNTRKWAEAEKLSPDAIQRLLAQPERLNVVYCSGTTKGNLYYEPGTHGDQWNHLVWTCVPSVKDAAAHYDYHEENPTVRHLPT